MTDTANLDEIVEEAVRVLERGGVLLSPTDTVYGLICSPRSEQAVNAVFDMKQRPANWRLPVIAADREQAEAELPLIWNRAADLLSRAFWPGALTLAFGIRENEIPWLSGRDEAGIRVPDHPFIRRLARKAGPFLMTSANRHGAETPHTMEGALASLAFPPALALDGGTLSGAPSTLVNVNLPVPAIERSGSIPDSEIKVTIQSALGTPWQKFRKSSCTEKIQQFSAPFRQSDTLC